ncbi:MAG: hypothetical protein ACI8QZ_000704 [Chlamydiales bacterium]
MENKFPSELPEASRIVAEGLLELAATRPELARAMRDMHRWFGRELDKADVSGNGHSSNGRTAGNERLGQKVLSMSGERRVVHLVEDHSDARRQRETQDVNLERVAERSACKATAYELAAKSDPSSERASAVRESLQPFAEDVPAGLLGVLSGEAAMPKDRGLAVLSACYGNVSLAAGIVLHLRNAGHLDGAPPTELLYLLAEAQSALLCVLVGAEVYADSDQHDLFLWLKGQTTRHRIYVDRHMRLDDPAECCASEDLAERLRKLDRTLERERTVADEQQRLLGKLRFHCGKVCSAESFEGADWETLLQVATDWCRAGYSVGNAAAVLSPLEAILPPDLALPADLEQLVHASPESGSAGEASAAERWRSREDLLQRARELLAGRTVALFARREREPSKAALEEEFSLAALHWIELHEDETVEQALEQEIVRPEVNLVLIAMRLPAPLYDFFKDLCIKHKKPFVRLPNGYGPGQVAQQVLRQIGRRLRPVEAEISQS